MAPTRKHDKVLDQLADCTDKLQELADSLEAMATAEEDDARQATKRRRGSKRSTDDSTD